MNIEALWIAVCIVESACNPAAVGDQGQAYGIAQIHAVMVQDFNQHNGTQYRHKDAFSVTISKRIFTWYVGHYCTAKRLGRLPTMEDAARCWNGGPNGYKKTATIKYWQKIRRNIK